MGAIHLVIAVLLFAIALPLALIVYVLALPAIAAWSVAETAAVAIHCRRHPGDAVLVCTARHGWKEFLDNNVVPVLPTRLTPHWGERPTRWAHRAAISRVQGVQRPFLIQFMKRNTVVIPLHEPLRALKQRSGKRDVQVQQQVRTLIERHLR